MQNVVSFSCWKDGHRLSYDPATGEMWFNRIGKTKWVGRRATMVYWKIAGDTWKKNLSPRAFLARAARVIAKHIGAQKNKQKQKNRRGRGGRAKRPER